MDLQRLQSGKFAINQLVLNLACLTYNLLWVIGQATLGRPDVSLWKPTQRRRIRTLIQNIILCAAKLIFHVRTYCIRYGRGNQSAPANSEPDLLRDTVHADFGHHQNLTRERRYTAMRERQPIVGDPTDGPRPKTIGRPSETR